MKALAEFLWWMIRATDEGMAGIFIVGAILAIAGGCAALLFWCVMAMIDFC